MWGQAIGGIRRRVMLAMVVALAAPVSLAATTDFTRFEGDSDARQLSDSELGNLRGRYVDQGTLMYFGVQMVSHWRTASGDNFSAGARMAGDLTRRLPTVSFEPTLTVIKGANEPVLANSYNGNGATVVDHGTRNGSGVVQSIQAGGDFNTASNDLVLDVMSADKFRGRGNPRSSGGSIQQALGGTRITASAKGNDMQVSIDLPGMGHVTQSITPGRGLRQAIQLSSNFQTVRNMTRLQLYMGNGASLSRGSVPGMLRSVHSAAALR
ncbi:hypothetical protein [Halomonas binhaiensis]|uniref:Uncharacterized protein n=1 Tax=Halomonas binhaiensis TaxID=2562282 RepID=A0A5C1NC97_9GAMM|nr:hypothetical protein [Halomonas binhaiensis]QEM80824.1 hypothetical protein E4T21_04095 [Halomonas binhaiensis]